MFKLKMIRSIKLKSNNGNYISNVTLYKTINLSFSPSLGLTIVDRGRELTVKQLCWDVKLKELISSNEEEITTHETENEWLKFEKNMGWKVM